MPQSVTRELTDENIFQLLAQGTLILMEDDLRALQGDQAKVVKEKRVRGRLKITPQEGARMSTPPIVREGFLSRIKNKLFPSKQLKVKEPPQGVLNNQLPDSFIKEPVPVGGKDVPGEIIKAPQPAFPVSDTKPSPIVKKKELASGLRLGESIIEPAQGLPQPAPVKVAPAAPLPPASFVPLPPPVARPAAVQPLSDNLKAEPYATDDLQERIKDKSRLEQEKSELDAKLQVFWPQRRPLELKIAALREDKQAAAKSLSPYTAKEAQIRAQEKDVAEKEKKAQLPQERHQLEEQRWALEEQRQAAEKQKWAQEEKIEAKNAEIQVAESQLQAVLKQEGDLRQQKETVIEGLEKICLAQERLMLINKVDSLDLQRRSLNKERLALKAEENLFNKELKEIRGKEQAFETQVASLEEAIEKATSFKEKKEIEQNRWRIDEQRRGIEQKRWGLEKSAEKNKEEASVLEKSYDEILRKQMAVEIRAEEIDILLRNSFADAENILRNRNRQKDLVEAAKKREIEERSEQIKPLLPDLEPVERTITDDSAPPRSKGLAAPSIRKAPAVADRQEAPAIPEVLSAAEAQTAVKIRQKAKEIEREKKLALIQQEAQTRRESPIVPKIKGPISKADILLKLSQVSPDEQVYRERFLARLAGHTPIFAIKPERGDKDIVFRPLVKKSSFFEKILARIMFLLIIFAVAVAAVVLVYFYIIMPKPKVYPQIPPAATGGGATTTTVLPIGGENATSLSAVMPTSTESGATTTIPEVPATSTAPTSTPAIALPEPLISVSTTTVFEVAATTSIADLLKTALQNNQGSGLNEILFRTTDNFFLGLNGILIILRTPWPESVSEQLASGDAMFISGEGAASRFGFIEKVKNVAALTAALKAWEPKMESDWAELWTVLGKTKPALVRYFLNAKYQNMSFRYQTFNKQDFGICYAVVDDYLVVATSYAQMKLILDEIKKLSDAR